MAPGEFDRLMTERVNICWGLQEGNSGVSPEGPARNVAEADAGDVRNPADPEGWHDLPESDGPGFAAHAASTYRATRKRLIASTPPSRTAPSARTAAAWQSTNTASTQPWTRRAASCSRSRRMRHPALLRVPRRRPQRAAAGGLQHCRRARDSARPAARPQGCTHLNDALRALAEVPKLAGYLASA